MMHEIFAGFTPIDIPEYDDVKTWHEVSALFPYRGWAVISNELLRIGGGSAEALLGIGRATPLTIEERSRHEGRLSAIREFFSMLRTAEQNSAEQKSQRGGKVNVV